MEQDKECHQNTVGELCDQNTNKISLEKEKKG